jgi:hypothetical protein
MYDFEKDRGEEGEQSHYMFKKPVDWTTERTTRIRKIRQFCSQEFHSSYACLSHAEAYVYTTIHRILKAKQGVGLVVSHDHNAWQLEGSKNKIPWYQYTPRIGLFQKHTKMHDMWSMSSKRTISKHSNVWYRRYSATTLEYTIHVEPGVLGYVTRTTRKLWKSFSTTTGVKMLLYYMNICLLSRTPTVPTRPYVISTMNGVWIMWINESVHYWIVRKKHAPVHNDCRKDMYIPGGVTW